MIKDYEIIYQQNNKQTKIKISTDDLDRYISNNLKNKNIIDIDKKQNLIPKSYKVKKIDEIINSFDIMLQANIKLDEVVLLVRDGYKANSNEYLFLSNVYDCMKAGKPIYEAFALPQFKINNTIVSFLKLAQDSGEMKKTIKSLSLILKKSTQIKEKIYSKLKYPLILLTVLMVSFIVIFMVVVPKFEYIFSQFDTKLPYITVLFLKIKENFLFYLFVVLFFMFFSSLVIRYLKQNYKDIKLRLDKVALFYIPYFSSAVFLFEKYRFFMTIKTIIRANYKFETALKISKNSTTNSYILDKLDKIQLSIEQGDEIYSSFENSKLFDSWANRLLLSSQQSGDNLSVISKIDTIYEDKLNKKIENISLMIEPILIVLIGLFVLFMMLAIFLPVWELGTIIK